MDETDVSNTVSVLLLATYLFAIYATINVAYRIYKIVKSAKEECSLLNWPALFLLPARISDEGKMHRYKLLRMLPYLLLSYFLLFA